VEIIEGQRYCTIGELREETERIKEYGEAMKEE
jgi:hypothetical protein